MFNNAEIALQHAAELMHLEKKKQAMTVLNVVIKSKKFRTWSKIHESVMTKYLYLCVDLRKLQAAKEALYSYRNMSYMINCKSIEDMIHTFLNLTEEKLNENMTEQSSQVHNILFSVDNEIPDTPAKPWVKFLWDAFRVCLELIKNFPLLENVYYKIAQKAILFCCAHTRRIELRRLCNNLRITHMNRIRKMASQDKLVRTQVLYLETKTLQLKCSIEMDLWMEAFKAIENMHDSFQFFKRTLNPALLADYYTKLAILFWKGNNLLFHAATCFRFFILMCEQKKKLTAENILKIRIKIILATLAVPIDTAVPKTDSVFETDDTITEANLRLLSKLLDLSNPPTRCFLIKEIRRSGIVDHVSVELQNLFNCLELDLNLLKMKSVLIDAFKYINSRPDEAELKQYVPPILEVAVVKLLMGLATVYKTIKLTHFFSLIPPCDEHDVERLIVDSARRYRIFLNVDQVNECIRFRTNMDSQEQGNQTDFDLISSTENSYLIDVYSNLKKIANLIEPVYLKKRNKSIREKYVHYCRYACESDHERLSRRRKIIEDVIEMREQYKLQKEAEEKRIMLDKQRKFEATERERLLKEAEKREAERRCNEEEEIRRKIKADKAELLKKTDIGLRILENIKMDNLDDIELDDLLQKQLEQMHKERQNLNEKLQRQGRALDHLERAKRIEEIPLLETEYQESKIEDREFWEKFEKGRIAALEKQKEIQQRQREKFKKIKSDMNKFLLRKKKDVDENIASFNEMVAEERSKRLLERKNQRKLERRNKWLEERELLAEKERKEKEKELLASAKKLSVDSEIVVDTVRYVKTSSDIASCSVSGQKEILRPRDTMAKYAKLSGNEPGMYKSKPYRDYERIEGRYSRQYGRFSEDDHGMYESKSNLHDGRNSREYIRFNEEERRNNRSKPNRDYEGVDAEYYSRECRRFNDDGWMYKNKSNYDRTDAGPYSREESGMKEYRQPESLYFYRRDAKPREKMDRRNHDREEKSLEWRLQYGDEKKKQTLNWREQSATDSFTRAYVSNRRPDYEAESKSSRAPEYRTWGSNPQGPPTPRNYSGAEQTERRGYDPSRETPYEKSDSGLPWRQK